MICDESDYLLTTVFHEFRKNGAKKDFLIALEGFIINNRIKEIPQDKMKKIFSFYLSKANNNSFVENLILNLSSSEFDLNAKKPLKII